MQKENTSIKMRFLIHLLVFPFILQLSLAAINDETLTEKFIGQDVVFASLSKIQNTFIFFDDYDLLKRIALVESEFGISGSTFPPNFYGGIWQLSELNYEKTKDVITYPALAQIHADLQNKFKFDWKSTSWEDLLKPFHSALAARLYLYTVAPKIPETLKEQATLWKNYYSNEDSDTEQYFIDLVTTWENTTLCKGKMELLVVLDESGSIGIDNFQLAKEFVARLFASYSLEDVRQGFVTYSSGNRVQFEIENALTAAEIQTKVRNLDYVGAGTATNDAILEAVAMFSRIVQVRPGIPKIMLLLTDGQSNDGVSNIAYAKAANITSFGIGIANYVMDELIEIAYGDQSHALTVSDFDALVEFFRRLNQETCDVPRNPSLNDTVEETIEKGDKQIYYFDLSPNGVNVILEVETGSISGYYSYTFDHPSSALNDGQLSTDNPTYIHPSFAQQLYITLEGLDETSKYSLTVVPSLDPPFFGIDGPCEVQGESGHSNDCSLYHSCQLNEAGDLWETIYQCSGGQVWCPATIQCESLSVCQCDI